MTSQLRAPVEHQARYGPEPPADAVELGLRVGELDTQALVHVLVEVLEERLAGVVEACADLLVHLRLQRAEGEGLFKSNSR